MISEKRILAARANGAKSRGPKTPEGKARSRFGVRSRRLAESNVLSNESIDSFRELFHNHVASFAPCNDVELGMVEEMSSAYWRIRRGWAIENYLLDRATAEQPEGEELPRLANAYAKLLQEEHLPHLRREETRLHMMFQRSLYNLVLLRTAKLHLEPKKSNDCSISREIEEPSEPKEPKPAGKLAA
ncbi:MAG: hypothetical protein ABI759_21825 [Candidatus Solibacter sp.]